MQRPRRRPHFSMLFANISEWGPQAREFVDSAASKGYDILSFVEHHMCMKQLEIAAQWLRHRGWALIGSAAQQASVEHSGGAMIAVRSHLHCFPVAAAPRLWTGREKANPSHGFDWVCMEVRLRRASLVIFAVYLTHSIGAAGVNLQKLNQLVQACGQLDGPILMVGDWNLEPHELASSGVFDALPASKRLSPLVPPAEFTCTSGQGRVIDFAMVNQQARAILSGIEIDKSCPWKTHAGIAMQISCTPAVVMVRALVRPANVCKPNPRHCDQRQQCTW